MFQLIAHKHKLFHIFGYITAKPSLEIVLFDTITARRLASLADRNARIGALRTIAQLSKSEAKPCMIL